MTSPAVMENPARIDAVKCQLQPEGKLSRCSTATLCGIVSECNAAAVQLVVRSSSGSCLDALHFFCL